MFYATAIRYAKGRCYGARIGDLGIGSYLRTENEVLDCAEVLLLGGFYLVIGRICVWMFVFGCLCAYVCVRMYVDSEMEREKRKGGEWAEVILGLCQDCAVGRCCAVLRCAVLCCTYG